MMDCFYPAAAAQLGSYTFKQGVALTICSSDDSPSDWATVRFTRPLGDAVQLKRMDAAALYLGYSGSFTKVFEGLLAADFASSGSVREVRLRDAALRLALTPLNHSFAGATPQEVVRYCCRAAGIPSLELSSAVYPQRVYPVISGTALSAIGGINHHWGVSASGYMQDGVYRWGKPPVQTAMMLFEYGKNIVSLTKERGLWVLTTVSVPQLRHSTKFRLVHPQLSGDFMIRKVLFTVSDAGFIRSKIFFKGV